MHNATSQQHCSWNSWPSSLHKIYKYNICCHSLWEQYIIYHQVGRIHVLEIYHTVESICAFRRDCSNTIYLDLKESVLKGKIAYCLTQGQRALQACVCCLPTFHQKWCIHHKKFSSKIPSSACLLGKEFEILYLFRTNPYSLY